MTELMELGRLRLDYQALQQQQNLSKDQSDIRKAKLEELQRQIDSKIDQDYWYNQVGYFDKNGNPIEPKVGELFYDAVGGEWWFHANGSAQRRPPNQ